jgi:RimJ/RimL family protein N-acetyltransferase
MVVDYVAVLAADLDAAEPPLREMDGAAAARPWRDGAWTRKEVLGHLIDSASVNHERFVRATESADLSFPGYDQDAWVASQRYRDTDWNALVALWLGLNRYLVHLMTVVPDEVRLRPRDRHTLDRIAFRTVPASRPASLDDLMRDYVVHLEHHLTQILGSGWAFVGDSADEAAGRTILETDRLVLSELTQADLPFVAEMMGDVETMRFYPHVLTPLEARTWLARQLERYARDGHGLWLVVERASGQKTGQVGLAMQEVEGRREPEIGWLVRRRFWRRGIATEAGAAVRDLAFDKLGMDRVVSLIRPVNEPSRGVARKIGMSPEREVTFHDYHHLVYAVRRPDA